MFDIDGSHIAELNDTDLRTLVARLCEAELRRTGLPRPYEVYPASAVSRI